MLEQEEKVKGGPSLPQQSHPDHHKLTTVSAQVIQSYCRLAQHTCKDNIWTMIVFSLY